MKKIFLIFLVIIISLLFLINSDVRSLSEKKVIKLQIGNKIALVDDNKLTLDVPPQIINGRTMVPVRFISEGLGADIEWDGATKTVTITMDSIEYLKSKIFEFENQIKGLQEDLDKKDALIKQKDEKIEELQIKSNNLENTKVRVSKVVTFKSLVDNKWTDITDTFKSTDDNVYIGVTTSFLEDAKYNLQVNVYDPFGNLIYTAKWDNQDQKKGSSWNYWYKILIKNYLVGAIPGVWKAKVLIDGKECGIVKFNVIKDDKYIDSGFRIKYVFYDPKGNYYTDVFIDIKSIKVNEESWAWGSIKIKGFPLENKPGEWKCKVYFEEDLVKEISFIIE